MPRKLTKDIFIDNSIKKHKNKFDYSLVKYINNSTKVKIICLLHGVYEQTPYGHMKGLNGCKECNLKKKRFTSDDFIRISNEKHNNKFDYSKVEYETNRIPVKIICKKHGEFIQLPFSHMNGSGCEKCLYVDLRKVNKLKFIESSNILFNNKYNYDKVDYYNNDIKVIITCKEHGEFLKEPGVHLKGQGCIICSNKISKGELIISKVLDKLNIEYIKQKTFEGCVNKQKLNFDFYLPTYNLCIEFNGIQHYKPIKYFGGEKKLNYQINNDNIKKQFCIENNTKLLIIPYYKIKEIESIITGL